MDIRQKPGAKMAAFGHAAKGMTSYPDRISRVALKGFGIRTMRPTRRAEAIAALRAAAASGHVQFGFHRPAAA